MIRTTQRNSLAVLRLGVQKLKKAMVSDIDKTTNSDCNWNKMPSLNRVISNCKTQSEYTHQVSLSW